MVSQSRQLLPLSADPEVRAYHLRDKASGGLGSNEKRERDLSSKPSTLADVAARG